MRHTFATKAETETFFRKFGEELSPKTIVLLQGQMGAGKSQSVKWLCGVESTSSPSYALHHSYHSRGRRFEHFDLDRLNGDDDLESIGFWDIFSDEDAIVLIEWPERLNIKELPTRWKIVRIQIVAFGDSEKREISIL